MIKDISLQYFVILVAIQFLFEAYYCLCISKDDGRQNKVLKGRSDKQYSSCIFLFLKSVVAPGTFYL